MTPRQDIKFQKYILIMVVLLNIIPVKTEIKKVIYFIVLPIMMKEIVLFVIMEKKSQRITPNNTILLIPAIILNIKIFLINKY